MIKILTLLGNNYGGCLQAVALQKILKKYDKVETIYYDEYLNKKKNIKKIGKDIIYLKRNIKFKKFRKEHLTLTKERNKLEDDLKSIYIVGSDQVWNPTAMPYEIRKNFYLHFVQDKQRKCSYAASVGEEVLDHEKEEKIIELLKDFEKISVRETSSKEYLEENYSLNVTQVLDPTLLINKTVWDSMIKKKYNQRNYILVYTLGMSESCNKSIDEFAKENGKKIIEIFYKKRFKNTKKVENSFGPLEFIEAIANGDTIITNSFHGMVFSIIYQKDFYVITRSKMNSRIYDLLKILGLTDRIIKEEEIEKLLEKETTKIDYKKVNEILETERKKSIEFIESIVKHKK